MAKGFKAGAGSSEASLLKESPEYPGCFYREADGVTEWLNPPMVFGIEYRTVERVNNEVVYAKAINFGALPNTGVKSVSTGLSKTTRLTQLTFIADDSAGASSIVDYTQDLSVWVAENYSKISCNSTSDTSAIRGRAFLKYTK